MLSKTPDLVESQVVRAESRRGHQASPRGCGRKIGSDEAVPPVGIRADCIWSGTGDT